MSEWDRDRGDQECWGEWAHNDLYEAVLETMKAIPLGTERLHSWHTSVSGKRYFNFSVSLPRNKRRFCAAMIVSLFRVRISNFAKLLYCWDFKSRISISKSHDADRFQTEYDVTKQNPSTGKRQHLQSGFKGFSLSRIDRGKSLAKHHGVLGFATGQ